MTKGRASWVEVDFVLVRTGGQKSLTRIQRPGGRKHSKTGVRNAKMSATKCLRVPILWKICSKHRNQECKHMQSVLLGLVQSWWLPEAATKRKVDASTVTV